MDHSNQIKNGTILVQIPAYKDPELLTTVRGALLQADNPNRIHFAVCYQDDDKSKLFELQKVKNCRIIDVDQSDARGSCYARYLCQKVLNDEDYVMHIDAHLRFIKHWDTKIISQLLSYNDDKAIISTYIDDYKADAIRSLPLDDPFFDNPSKGHLRYVRKIRDNYFYAVEHRLYRNYEEYEKYGKKCYLVAGGYFFSFAQADRDVLYDPAMVFQGDEIPYGLRLFTYGYNIYSPFENYALHHYHRSDRAFPDVSSNNYGVETARFKYLLGLESSVPESEYDIKDFGLGTVRTVADYEKATGFNFRIRSVSESTKSGDFSESAALSYDLPKNYLLRNSFVSFNIFVCILFDGSVDLERLIDDYTDKAFYKSSLRFIVYGVDMPTDLVFNMSHRSNVIILNMSSHQACENQYFYGNAYNRFARYVKDNDYVLCVRSCVVPIKNWDIRWIDVHVSYGDKCILTCGLFTIGPNSDRVAYNPFALRLNKFMGPYFSIQNGDSVSSDVLTPFISYDVVFGKGLFLRNVVGDPYMSGVAFSTTYSVRLWTHGYDIIIPRSSYFCKMGSFAESTWHNAKSHSEYQAVVTSNMFDSDTNILLSDYGCGESRTIRSYCAFAGISMISRQISKRAFYGVNFSMGLTRKDLYFDSEQLPVWKDTHIDYINSVTGTW